MNSLRTGYTVYVNFRSHCFISTYRFSSRKYVLVNIEVNVQVKSRLPLNGGSETIE